MQRKVKNPNLRAKAIHQLQYKKSIQEIKRWMRNRDIGPLQSDVWIYPNYPYGYEAAVCAWNRVWLFRRFGTHFYIDDIQPLQGFRPNGTIIFKKPGYFDSK